MGNLKYLSLLLMSVFFIFPPGVFAQAGNNSFKRDSIVSRWRSITEQINLTPSFLPGIALLPITSAQKNTKTFSYLSEYVQQAITRTSMCSDTSRSVLFSSGIDSVSFVTHCIERASNGDFILGGSYADSSVNIIQGGLILRVDSSFRLTWIKKYTPQFATGGYAYYKIKELNDGSLLALGSFSSATHSTLYGLSLTRIAADGDLIWAKTYYPETWLVPSQSFCFLDFVHIVQDTDGSIYLSGREMNQLSGTRNNGIIIKVDLNGNIVWDSNPVEGTGYATRYAGLAITGNRVVAFGTTMAFTMANGTDPGCTGIYAFDKTTGDTITTKALRTISDPLILENQWTMMLSLTQMDNGDVIMAGRTGGEFRLPNPPDTFETAGYMRFNPGSLSFLYGRIYKTFSAPAIYNTRLNIFPDENAFFTYSSISSAYSRRMSFVQSYKDQIIRQRSKQYTEHIPDYQSEIVQTRTKAHAFCQLVFDSSTMNGYRNPVEILKLSVSDSSSVCLGTNEYNCYLDTMAVTDAMIYFTSMGKNIMVDTSFGGVLVSDLTALFQTGCEQAESCDSLKLTAAPDTLCNSPAPFLITAQRNKNCRTPITWNSHSGKVLMIQPQSDTSAYVWVNGPGECYITGVLASSCGNLTDSIKLVVPTPASDLELGPDLTICGTETHLLNARKGFKTYLWQNGSTDSVFLATIPGQYVVRISDFCGNTSSDTVYIHAAAPEVINIGKDTFICNKDTLLLSAPANFSSYSWFPNYQISTTSSPVTSVFPDTTTTYYLHAAKNPGCVSADTITITVYPLPKDFIKHDTAICNNKPLLLEPTSDFSAYLWSTGEITKRIVITAPGVYSLRVTDSKGCTEKEPVIISQKNCLSIVYFPNSFSPNNDGINDLFRPKVYGVIEKFKLTVFNRYGEIVFRTSDAATGWDGKYKSRMQLSHVFTWIAEYQLQGKLPQTQKGTVLLIQ